MREAIKRIEDGGHSVFAPSSSKMWLNCAGSLIPNIFADDDSGEEAAYGTVAHGVGEEWLRTGQRPRHLIGTKRFVETPEWGFLIEIDENMLDHLERYVNWVKFLPGQHFIETRVDFSCLTPIPNQGGTADHAACSPGRMVITDLKMGERIHVVAEENTQAQLYALGFFYAWDWFYDFQEIEIRIAQPRRDNMDVWIISREKLLKFAERVKARAAAAWIQNAPRSPSSGACEWCKVNGTCAAYAKFLADMTEGVFEDLTTEVSESEMVEFKQKLDLQDDLEPASTVEMSTSQLGKLLEWKSSIRRFFENVEEELLKRSHRGDTSKLWTIGEGRTHRVFPDKKKAGAALVAAGCKPSDVFFEEIPSPAQAEELLKKAGMPRKDIPDYLRGLTFKPPGKKVLVKASERRPPLPDMSEGVFGDTTQQTETEEI